MSRLSLPRHLLRSAGRRRVRTARELLAALRHGELTPDEIVALRGYPPVAGGSQAVLTVTSNVALGTGQATLAGPLLGNGQAPLLLALGWVSNVTGVAAAAGVTANIVRNDTAAVIGSAVVTNNGAGAGAVGGIDPIAVVPSAVPPGNGITLQAAVSSGTATAVGSATAPITLALLGIV